MRIPVHALLVVTLLVTSCASAPAAPLPAGATAQGVAALDVATAAHRFAYLQSLASSTSAEAQASLESESVSSPTTLALPAGVTTLAVWSEFLPFAVVEAQLPALKARGCMLFVAIKPEHIGSPALLSLWRAAKAQGVPIRPWLLLAPGAGYWANKWNASQVRAHVHLFLDDLKSNGLSTEWVTLDVEPPATLTKQLGTSLSHFDLVAARRALVDSSHSASLFEARASYQQLVDELHQAGVKLHAVTSSSVLDEPDSGQYRMQSALGTPIEGVAWDEVTFMAYRPEFEKLVGGLGADLVYRYAIDAKRMFGDRAGMDVGEVGSPGYPVPSPGYTDPAQLQADLAAVRAAGIGRADIYSLDGMVQLGGVGRWISAPAAARPPRSLKAALLRCFFKLIARTLPAGA
jgi:hypothetical protein